jgi:hypothetical protein
MQQLLWIAIAWLGGIAAILGSLMTLGSLLLWLASSQPMRTKKTENQSSAIAVKSWQGRLKVTVFSLAIALTGLSLLIAVPFPKN